MGIAWSWTAEHSRRTGGAGLGSAMPQGGGGSSRASGGHGCCDDTALPGTPATVLLGEAGTLPRPQTPPVGGEPATAAAAATAALGSSAALAVGGTRAAAWGPCVVSSLSREPARPSCRPGHELQWQGRVFEFCGRGSPFKVHACQAWPHRLLDSRAAGGSPGLGLGLGQLRLARKGGAVALLPAPEGSRPAIAAQRC